MQIPKKKIQHIRNIAVISSNNAAGLKDFIDILYESNNNVNSINNIYIFPVTLQGSKMEKTMMDVLNNIFSIFYVIFPLYFVIKLI